MNRPRSILLIDDDSSVLESVALALGFDGHLVRSAESGRTAISIFQPGLFDLVITDHDMPGMNGHDLALSIKARSPAQPIVLLSGYAERFKPGNNRAHPFSCILAKPIEFALLRKTIADPTAGAEAVMDEN